MILPLKNRIDEATFQAHFPLPYVVRALSPWEAKACGLDPEIQQWRFELPFVYVSDKFGRIETEAGRTTDFASIPRGLQSWLQNDSPVILLASAPHDRLFETLGVTGPEGTILSFTHCNDVLTEAMYYLGATSFQRAAVYKAVMQGGKTLWNHRCDEQGKPERKA
jgi:hypothetical protein